MDPSVKPLLHAETLEALVSTYIKAAVRAAREVGINRDQVYEWAKDKINQLNPTADEYERAIKLLTEALQI